MQPTAEQSLQSGSKVRKSKRNITPIEYAGRQSVKDPKLAKQLIKNSEKHDIGRLIEDLIEDEEHGLANPQDDKKPSKNSQPKRLNSEEQEIGPDFQVPYEFERRFAAEFEEYNELYREMIAEETVIAEPLDRDFYAEDGVIKLLAKLYYLCGENYYEANALQLWNDLKGCFSEDELNVMEQDLKEFYKKHLFFFDRFSKTDKSKGSLIETLQLIVEYLSDPYIRRPSDLGLRTLDTNSINEIMNHQCTLLKGFVGFLSINTRIFSLAAIAQRYPFKEIDVIQRNPDVPVFMQNNVKKIVNHHPIEPEKIRMDEYYAYLIDSNIRVPQHVKDQDKMIKVGVDITLEDCKDQMDELKSKFPQQLLFNSKLDVLKMTNKKVPGVNVPRVDLQVEGAWIGGQEENLCLRTVNINHGPNSCYWYTVDASYGAEFRQAKKDLYTLDIHKDGDLWSGDIDFCLRNRIKLEYFVQEPGDIVITGPGCSVWTRSDGVTMTTAWNIFRKNKFEFEKAFERYELNNENDIKTKIPIKSITLNLVLQEFASTPVDLRVYLAEQLAKLYDKDLELYGQFKIIYPGAVFSYEPRKNIGFNCTACKEELLNFYAYCDFNGKGKKPRNAGVLVCLNCYIKDYDNYTAGPGTPVLPYYKMSPRLVEEFQGLLRNIEVHAPQIIAKHKTFAAYVDSVVDGDRKQELPGTKEQTNQKEPTIQKDQANQKEPMPVIHKEVVVQKEVPLQLPLPLPIIRDEPKQQGLMFGGEQLNFKIPELTGIPNILRIPPLIGQNGVAHSADLDFPDFPNLLSENYTLPALEKMEIENIPQRPIEKKREEIKVQTHKVEKTEKTEKSAPKASQKQNVPKPVKKEKTEDNKPKPQKSASDKSDKTDKKPVSENKPKEKEKTGTSIPKFKIEKVPVKRPEKLVPKPSSTGDKKEQISPSLQKEKPSPTAEKKDNGIPMLIHKEKLSPAAEKKDNGIPMLKEKPNPVAPRKESQTMNQKEKQKSAPTETNYTERFLYSIPALAPQINAKSSEPNIFARNMFSSSLFQTSSADKDPFKKKPENEEPPKLSLFEKIKGVAEPSIKEKEPGEDPQRRRLPEEATAAIEAAYTIKKRVKPDDLSPNKEDSRGETIQNNELGNSQNNGDIPRIPGLNL